MKNEYLIVDGYNIIFDWIDFKPYINNKNDFSFARDLLLEILSNYQGFVGNIVIVVFDSHRVKGGRQNYKYDNIHVVFTKHKETADNYIEKSVKKYSKDFNVRVATSDYLEQIIILGKGAMRVSARELKDEINRYSLQMKRSYIDNNYEKNNMVKNQLNNKTKENLKKFRS